MLTAILSHFSYNLQCLGTLDALVEAHVGDDICIVGDFNADPRRYSRFGVALRKFVEECHLSIADQMLTVTVIIYYHDLQI